MVDGRQDDAETADDQPSTPPAEQPAEEPDEPATPPSAKPDTQPKSKPVRPKPKPTQPKPTQPKPKPTPPEPSPTRPESSPPASPSADNASTPPRPQPSQNARVIVLSPMELVALIANKTSSFAFDAMLDRFDGASYTPGETFFVRVKSAKAGFLYLLQVDSSGTPALIYPTAGEDNRIPAGKLVDIHPGGGKAGFPVAGPAGVVRVKAVVTSRPLAFSGSLEGFQGQMQSQGQGTADQRQLKWMEVRPVQFRWHPTQRQQVQQLLSQEQPPADAQQLGCRPPQEILGPFAQDMMTFYLDTAGGNDK
jgi:hypothetical protein